MRPPAAPRARFPAKHGPGALFQKEREMDHVIVEVSFVPIGVEVSLSRYVAEALRLIRESGLRHEFHSMGTNIEGTWDEVMALVRTCQDRLFEMGAPRVSTGLKISERRDKPYHMADKVARVEELLGA